MRLTCFSRLITVMIIMAATACGDTPETQGPKDQSVVTLNRDHVIFTSIHYRQTTLSSSNEKSQWKPMRSWQPVSTRIRESFWGIKSKPLTPMDQIRLLVVLDKSLDNADPIDVTFQSKLLPKRNDVKSVARIGPMYSEKSRVLTEKDFLPTDFHDGIDRNKLIGRQGVVFQTYFTVGGRKFYGTKPLGDAKSAAGEIWSSYDSDNLLAYYSYEITLNNTPQTRQIMSIGWDGSVRADIDAYPVDLQNDRIHRLPFGKRGKLVLRKIEHYFIDEDILFSQAWKMPRTHLLDDIGKTWLFVRVRNKHKSGMEQFILPHENFKDAIQREADKLKSINMSMRYDQGILYLDYLDWQSPLEFVVFFNCGDQAAYKYEQAGLSYLKLPINATVFNDPPDSRIPDREGPTLKSSLINFGEKVLAKGAIVFRPEDRTNRYRFKRDIMKLIDDHDFLVPEKPGQNRDRFYYGAYFSVSFDTLSKKLAEADQAFESDADGYYRLYLSFNTGAIGFNATLDHFPIYVKLAPKVITASAPAH